MTRAPHPVCGCLKPANVHRHDGPCGWCRKDADRQAGIIHNPRINDPIPTVDDFRKWRKPLLEATDWVDTNPARVSREPPEYVSAIRAYRDALFAGPETYAGGPMPAMPERPAQI